jgi:hypothetical protein
MPMRFVRTIGTVGLADVHAFQCDPCSLLLTGEAVAEAQQMADAALATDMPKRPAHPLCYSPERVKQLIDHMTILRSRWLARQLPSKSA